MSQQALKKTILVVDDIEANIDILVELLGDIYEVKVALDGASALEEVAEEKPDLILLDIMMPEMDGYEVCSKIKSKPDLNEIPIIFLTAKSETWDEAKGLSMGAVDYIVKPFNPEILMTRVKTHLLLKDQQDQLKQSISILEHRNELLEQKAEIGIQTGGLAHDMANILTVALSVGYLLPEEPPEDKEEWAEIREDARQIVETVKLGVDICQGFTSYLRDIGAKESIQRFDDLLPVINMYGRQFKGELIKEIDSETPQIKCKAYQIKRVLVNLFVNASQAVQDQDAPQIGLRLWEDNGMVYFAIRDNGCGIRPDILPRIFEERFTTKDKGTGLGLFLVKQIVDSHDGSIKVISNPDQGTEVILSFPACP